MKFQKLLQCKPTYIHIWILRSKHKINNTKEVILFTFVLPRATINKLCVYIHIEIIVLPLSCTVVPTRPCHRKDIFKESHEEWFSTIRTNQMQINSPSNIFYLFFMLHSIALHVLLKSLSSLLQVFFQFAASLFSVPFKSFSTPNPDHIKYFLLTTHSLLKTK